MDVLRIRETFQAVRERMSLPYKTRFTSPQKEYRRQLEQAGLHPELVTEFDRPAPLKDGTDGLCNWTLLFFRENLKNLHEKRRLRIFEEMEKALRDDLWDGARWVADYRRLRGAASK